MVTRSKPPASARRIPSDDCTVVVGDEVYYPHAGEWVEYRGRPSVGVALGFMSGPEGSATSIKLLATEIASWNWTDDEGRPYPSPPTADDLLRLPKEELGWLIGHAESAAPLDEDARKNASTPST